MVDIEAGVYVVHCVVDVVEEVAAFDGGFWSGGDGTWGREGGRPFLKEVGKAASFGSLVDTLHVCLIEANDGLEVVECWDDGGWVMVSRVTKYGNFGLHCIITSSSLIEGSLIWIPFRLKYFVSF